MGDTLWQNFFLIPYLEDGSSQDLDTWIEKSPLFTGAMKFGHL